MNDMMEYKGYHTKAEYDSDSRLLVGEVIGINDLITFAGDSVEKFEHAFHESVDGYLDMCIRNNKTPDTEHPRKNRWTAIRGKHISDRRKRV